MGNPNALAAGGCYRPLNLVGYRSAPPCDGSLADAVSASRARRLARQARRQEERARQAAAAREMTASFAKAALTLALSAAVGAVAFVRIGMSYEGLIPENGIGATTEAVTEVDGDGNEWVVPTDQGAPATWQEPDIAGDCPVVWERQPDGSFANNNGAVLGSGCKFGVDVSEHDGWIDWEAAKAGGVEFAIIRCGFGTDSYAYDDECWEYNASECERLGIPYGAYAYSYAPDPSYAVSEAEHVARLVSGHPCPLGVWYDIEEASQAESFGYDPVLFDELVDGFAGVVEGETDLRVGVYTSRSWLDGHMSKVAEDGEHPIWCACWTDGCPTGVAYDYWQAGAAMMPGFSGPVDFDVVLG